MTRRALLDTGFVVALVNAKDPDHARCRAAWEGMHARLFSVEGVLVESAHLLRRVPGGATAASGIIFDSGTEIVPLTSERARRATELMGKYADVPMDLVDALLVTVAEDQDVPDVLTLDERGFRSYRLRGRTRFDLVP